MLALKQLPNALPNVTYPSLAFEYAFAFSISPTKNGRYGTHDIPVLKVMPVIYIIRLITAISSPDTKP
jgi:hypothetical protein